MRNLLLTWGAVVSGALAGVFLLMSLLAIFGGTRQRDGDRQIDAVFAQAARYVGDFSKTNGTLPSQSEFTAWADAQPTSEPNAYAVQHVSYQLGIPPKELHYLGTPSTPTYYLEIWRGEWSEYFAPWVGRSTIEPSGIRWYLETRFYIGAVCLLLAIGLLFLCRKLWSNRRMQPHASMRG